MTWETFSIILNIVLGLWVFYLYFENRKLKGYEIDKDIKIKEEEIADLEFYIKHHINDPFDPKKTELKKLNTELEHLKKLKRYRWIFSK